MIKKKELRMLSITDNIGNENALLAAYVFYPLLLIILGKFNKKYPPKYPPDIYGRGTMRTTYGYMTPTSRKSRANWVKAQELFVNYLIASGYIILVISIVIGVLKIMDIIDDNMIFYAQMGTLAIHTIGCFAYCESSLRKYYSKQ